jgi:hypothetical protein
MPTTNPNTTTKIKLSAAGIAALKARGLSDNTMMMIINQAGEHPPIDRRNIRWLCIQVLGQYGYEFEVATDGVSGE